MMLFSCSGYICIPSLGLMLLIDQLVDGNIHFYQLPYMYPAGKYWEMAWATLVDHEFAIIRGVQAKSEGPLIRKVMERLPASYNPAGYFCETGDPPSN